MRRRGREGGEERGWSIYEGRIRERGEGRKVGVGGVQGWKMEGGIQEREEQGAILQPQYSTSP